MFKVSELLKCLVVGITVICVGAIILLPFFGAFGKETNRYEAEATITHLDASQRYRSTIWDYSVAFVGEDFSDTIEVDRQTYARLSEGDTIKVVVITMENGFGDTRNKYEIIEKNP